MTQKDYNRLAKIGSSLSRLRMIELTWGRIKGDILDDKLKDEISEAISSIRGDIPTNPRRALETTIAEYQRFVFMRSQFQIHNYPLGIAGMECDYKALQETLEWYLEAIR